jgi:hypothetical protein
MKTNNKTNKNNILRRIFSFQKRYKKCLVNSSPLTLNKKKKQLADIAQKKQIKNIAYSQSQVKIKKYNILSN